MQAWHGYSQTLGLTQSGLTVAIDKAIVAMPVMEPLVFLVAQVRAACRGRDWSSQLHTKAKGAPVNMLHMLLQVGCSFARGAPIRSPLAV